MENIFRSLSFTITQLVYPLISYLYNIFELIAKNQFFTNSDIEALSQNIYIIISACMLFTLGLKLLSAIVNPDALDGGGNGQGSKRTAKSIFFSILISLFLIIMIPIGFKYLYDIQANVLDNQLVEKIVLGTDTSEDHAPGQILASYAFASFCHPNETVSVESIANDGGNLYNLAITENIEYIKDMDGVINSKTDGEYDIEYHAILSPAVGLFLTYEMILTCIDIALRSIKLGLLQLITSVVLCGYVVAGSDLLKRWAKEVMSTYINVFLKVAAMSFMVYGLSLLEDFLDSLNFSEDDAGFWSRGLIRVFVIIGLLQLVKQIPDLINKIFGTNIKSRGGIRGRLGEMAAVGDLAQRAWDQVRTHPLQTGQRLLSAPISAIGSAGAHLGAAVQKGINLRQQMQNNGKSGLRSNFAMMRTMAGGLVGSFGAMFRGAHQGFQNGNIQGIGGAYRNYNDTHPTDMLEEHANRSLLQSINPLNSDRLRTMVGAPTRYESAQEADKYVDYNGRRMTFDELKARQSMNSAFNTSQGNIRSSIEEEMNLATSAIRFNVAGITDSGRSIRLTGNAANIREQIEALQNAAVGDGTNGELFRTETEKARVLANLNQRFSQHFDQRADALQNQVMNTGEVTGVLTGGRAAAVTNELNTITDLVLHNEALRNVIGAGHIGGVNADGILTFDANFRAGARIDVTNEMNSINRAVTDHNQQIEARSTTIGGREIEASHNALNARNNNGGNNNHGGNNNG